MAIALTAIIIHTIANVIHRAKIRSEMKNVPIVVTTILKEIRNSGLETDSRQPKKRQFSSDVQRRLV